MKTLATRILPIAAGVLALGTVAYGQTAMTAEIPFAFRASGTTMPAGKYIVQERTNTGVPVIALWNAAAKRNALTVGGPMDWNKKGEARMTFLCRANACYLSQIRSGLGTVNYPAPHKGKTQDAVAAASISVPLTARGE